MGHPEGTSPPDGVATSLRRSQSQTNRIRYREHVAGQRARFGAAGLIVVGVVTQRRRRILGSVNGRSRLVRTCGKGQEHTKCMRMRSMHLHHVRH